MVECSLLVLKMLQKMGKVGIIWTPVQCTQVEYCSEIFGGARRAKACTVIDCWSMSEYCSKICTWRCIAANVYLEVCCSEILGGALRAKACQPAVNHQPTCSQDKIVDLHINILHNVFHQSTSQVNIVNNHTKQQSYLSE